MKHTDALDMNARSSHKSRAKSLHHLEIHPTENGGAVIQHHFSHDNGYHEPEHYAFGKGEGKKAMAHIAKHANIEHESKAEAEKEESAAGAAY